MKGYDKKAFEQYLETKVAPSTAKAYAADMDVSVRALEKIKLYQDKDLKEILEDFVSHKKAVKNYLQDEFLDALTQIGSNDSGLYDSLSAKAKHYLAMLRNDEAKTEDADVEIKADEKKEFSDEEKEWLDDLWDLDEAPESIRKVPPFVKTAFSFLIFQSPQAAFVGVAV